MNGDKKKNLKNKYLNKYRPQEKPATPVVTKGVQERTDDILKDEIIQGEGTLSGIKGLYGEVENYLDGSLT